MKCLLFLCFCVLSNFSLHGSKADIIIKKVECNSSTLGSCSEKFCSVEQPGNMNAGCLLTRELSQVYITTIVYLKVGNGLRHLYTSPKLDWCTAFKGGAFGRFMRNYVSYVKEFAPAFAQKCPYPPGRYEIRNLTVSTKNFNFLPPGDYKNSLIVNDEIDENIFTLTHYTTSISKD